MKKPLRIGCLALLLYCIACSLWVAISGQGWFLFSAEWGTLQGGTVPERERIFLRNIDIVTAPLQVAILLPLAAVDYIQDHTGDVVASSRKGNGRKRHISSTGNGWMRTSTASMPSPVFWS